MPKVDLSEVIPVVGANGVPDPRKAPISAYRYLDAKRELIDAEARSRPLIRLWDNQMRFIGTVASELSVDVEELLHDTGQGDIVLRGDDWLVDFLRRDVRKDQDLHVTVDPYPQRRNWRWRWGGKVTNVRVKRDENGLRTVTLECAHNREHWKHLLFGATPFSDPAIQPLKAWLLPGNTRTIVSTTAFINLARNFFPLLALPTQALNPGAWTGEASNLLNLNPLNWPVQVAFVNPFLDQSRFSVIMSRWSDAHSVTEAMLRDSGCHVRAYTWLTEDEDSPHPELAAIIGQSNARPTRNCVVLSVDDFSGVTGPTGTAADGALSLIAVTADQVLETIYSVDADGDGVADPFIRRLVGVAPAVPSIAFRDTERSSIVSAEHSMFRAKASKILTGGKSPGWVNQAQCVHGSTIIDGPDGKERIDVLAARGESFRVWSLTPQGQRVPAIAKRAFKKGTAELFDYVLDDGRAIRATAQHRFLTDKGFVAGDDLIVGSLIATVNETDSSAPDVTARMVRDEQYIGLVETSSLKYRAVVSITPTGVDDYYDMYVPGWQNYAAHGMWNHNTFAIKYALSELSTVITLPGTAVTPPGTPGLEEIYQCVAADTVIDGPDGKERIDTLARRGEPFRVWSLTPQGQRVPAVAERAFRKGEAELFTYTLDNGDTITATRRHRFLTDHGFMVAADMTVGSMIATDPGWATAQHVPLRNVCDNQYVGLPQTGAVTYRRIISVDHAGVGDYYDMYVPGWHNYLAHGIWNHNSQFDDMLLAYIQITDPVRASRQGPYGYLEHFEQGSGSAWTISSSLTLREGHWKTRPYQGFKVSIRNGGAHSLFYDYDLGTRCHFEIDGVLHTDQITAIKLHYNKDTPKTFDLSIGDDRESENPLAAATRSLATLWSAVGMLFGSGDLF